MCVSGKRGKGKRRRTTETEGLLRNCNELKQSKTLSDLHFKGLLGPGDASYVFMYMHTQTHIHFLLKQDIKMQPLTVQNV